MVRNADAVSRREERTERRRSQVLDAARACFRAEGFHGASMSRIASVAGMSVGHIYQYFENKDAIIIALCERDFEELMSVPPLEEVDLGTVDGFVEAALANLPSWLDPSRTAITIEIVAEAGRNPRIAEVVRRVDASFRAITRETITPLLADLDPAEFEARLEMLILLIQGLPVRATAHPDMDRDLLADGFALALRNLLSASPAKQAV